MEFRLVPFGESEKNLATCMKYSIIGIRKKTKIEKGELLYLTIKKNKTWYLCGKAVFDAETEVAPFDNPERYYTYTVKDIVTCKPYEIGSVLRENLGQYWGLVFQTPRIIKNETVENYIEKGFVETKSDEMLKMVSSI